MANILDSYINPTKQVVGYEAWISWYTEKGSNRLSCSSITERNGKLSATANELTDVENLDELGNMINDVCDIVLHCNDADIITIHVSDYRIVRILKFGYVSKRLLSLVNKFKELTSKMEVIFVKDKWFQRDRHNEEVDNKAKDCFNKNHQINNISSLPTLNRERT